MARALDRLRSLAESIDREQLVVEDAQSTLLVELAKIAADSAAKETEAVAAARRRWWAEARESLLSLLSSSVHDGRGSRGSKRARVSPGGEHGTGGAGVDAPASEQATPPPATPSLSFVRARLDKIAADALATAEVVGADGADGGSAGSTGEGGGGSPLYLVVGKKRHRSDEAIRRCADAIEAARSDPRAWGGDGDGQITAAAATLAAAAEEEVEVENDSTVSSKEGSRGGDGCHRRAARNNGAPEEERGMGLFWSRLEAEAVQLAVASLEEAEARRLTPPSPPTATETEIGQTASSPSTSVLPEDHPPGDLTRSQLDQRRVGRVRDLAKALTEMLCRWREALVMDTLQVGLPCPSPKNWPLPKALGAALTSKASVKPKDSTAWSSGSSVLEHLLSVTVRRINVPLERKQAISRSDCLVSYCCLASEGKQRPPPASCLPPNPSLCDGDGHFESSFMATWWHFRQTR